MMSYHIIFMYMVLIFQNLLCTYLLMFTYYGLILFLLIYWPSEVDRHLLISSSCQWKILIICRLVVSEFPDRNIQFEQFFNHTLLSDKLGLILLVLLRRCKLLLINLYLTAVIFVSTFFAMKICWANDYLILLK